MSRRQEQNRPLPADRAFRRIDGETLMPRQKTWRHSHASLFAMKFSRTAVLLAAERWYA